MNSLDVVYSYMLVTILSARSAKSLSFAPGLVLT